MQIDKIVEGLKVKTIETLKDPKSIFIKQRQLAARKPNKSGKVFGCVAGHGGDVWWIEHYDGTFGAYFSNEFNPI